MLLLQIQGFGRTSWAGGKGSVELGEEALAQAAQQSQAGPSPGGGRDRDRQWL